MSESASKLAATLGFEFESGPEKSTQSPSRTRSLVEWSMVIVGAVIVAMLVKVFLVQAFYIPSGSMEPTLMIQDRVIVNKLSYRLHGVNRGDIVVFERPDDEVNSDIKDLIKRVIALPGESLVIEENGIYVNGRKVHEPYLPSGTVTSTDASPLKCTEEQPCVVPQESVWVMGDNRTNSRDSRWFGPISEKKIVGRAFMRVWPFNRFGAL